MRIRPARAEDLEAIAALYKQLFREAAAQQPRLWREAAQQEEFLRNNMETEYAALLVAEAGGKAVGFALAQQQMTPPFACFVTHRYAYLMDVCVAEEQRGAGIGAALVEAVCAWARERGLDYVELNVLEENEGAARLYRRLGFAESMRNMKRML